MSTTTDRRTTSTFSFAGCGFLGIYYIGICMYFQKHAKQYFSHLTSWYGASAGSLTVVAAACSVRAVEGYNCIKKLHDDACKHKYLGAVHPGFDLTEHLRSHLENVLPRDAHRQCRNKVGISLTVLPSMTNLIVTDFNTRAELIQFCCDGGLSNNLPHSTDPTVITVSPFSGECDICPNGDTETHHVVYASGQTTQISWKNLYRGFATIIPPSWSEMDEICAQGFRDAHYFIKREGH